MVPLDVEPRVSQEDAKANHRQRERDSDDGFVECRSGCHDHPPTVEWIVIDTSWRTSLPKDLSMTNVRGVSPSRARRV